MTLLALILAIWLSATIVAFCLVIAIGLVKIQRTSSKASDDAPASCLQPLEVIVPLKGIFAGQEHALRSLLEQDYPGYRMIFVLESECDPANSVVDKLLNQYPFAHKVIGGLAVSCAQKNHSLLAGLRSLRPDTEILVFCDSTNLADPGWLQRFTRPLCNGDCAVVTTFRAFHLVPETIGGVCQAIYASFIRLIAAIKPKPWGGATAIKRETFEELNIAEVWSRTIVDDLVLGNVLDCAGVKVRMDSYDLLESPLQNQSIAGFLRYLDRQILFPKFTNPGIWAGTLLFHVNLTVAIPAAVLTGVLFAAGQVHAICGWLSYGLLIVVVTGALLLWRINPSSISIKRWLISVFPCIFLSAYVFLRSVVRNYIDWHGRRYWPGKGGVVLETAFENEREVAVEEHAAFYR
ncbi:MAG: glycosyltransferase [Desulfomonilaceae bacterium]